MRRPFSLKNSIEDERYGLNQKTEVIDFDESLAHSTVDRFIERGGEHRFRTTLILVLVFLAFGGVFFRLYYLAIAKHEYYREIADGNRLRVEYLPAPRGAIYDSFGTVLAGNRPGFELVMNPLDLPKDEPIRAAIFTRVAKILGIEPAELEQLSANPQTQVFESILVRQNLTREQALVFFEQQSSLLGFQVVNVPIRDYHFALQYAHLLGYVGKISPSDYEERKGQGYLFNDSLGKTGLEQRYEEFLRGQFGTRQVEVDAIGAVQKVFGSKSAVPGQNLFLNIDAGLQERLFSSLTEQLVLRRKQKAAAIVMNPQNGNILAYLSLPAYDNNLFSAGISNQDYQRLILDPAQPLFNRAISGTYPPGSTVKPIIAAAALQESVIGEYTQLQDLGYIVIQNIFGGPDAFFYGYNRSGLGFVDVRKAIALSSDIFFYIVGGGYDLSKIAGLGIEKIASAYRQFFVDRVLGIDLPGEQPGLVPTPEWKKQQFKNHPVDSRWYLGNTYHVSIGQGDLLATPLHVLSWIATIANGGKIYKPHIVNRIEDNGGKLLAKFDPEILSELTIDPYYIQVVQEGLRETVTLGTAKSLQSVPVSVSGKTGTAQFDARDLNRAHAWFAGYAPSENPEIAIVVLIEDGGEGSSAAVPVAREVLDWWAKNRYNKLSTP